ncbi:hypothetical protein CEP54_013141 [Fusarium duplospermum]|uniref:Uncharacterized protein n=1 Tax=Fusarium duplospermum TaxID=1325734 RepID=A0A428P4L9_9HYPO|nr:hypothetical protein CEP54_013141 [Fusarium duplospermum]
MSPPSANNSDLMDIIYRSAKLVYGASLELYIDCTELSDKFCASLLAGSHPHANALIDAVQDNEIKSLLDILRQICLKCIERIEANRRDNSLTPLSDDADYESDTREVAKTGLILPDPNIQYTRKPEGHCAKLQVRDGFEISVEGRTKEELAFQMMKELCKEGLRLRPEANPVGRVNPDRVA